MLKLYPGASPCIRSGYCCKKSPCAFGVWDEAQKQCQYLETSDRGEYQCGIYEQIIQQPGWEMNPAFGAGCCSPMNSDRLSKRLNKSKSLKEKTK